MNFDEFTGGIQHRLELPGTGETLRATRATLLTMGQRLPEGQAEDIAASVPMEIKWYMTGAVHDLVPDSDFQELRDSLPESEDDGNWRNLFELVDAGGWSGDDVS